MVLLVPGGAAAAAFCVSVECRARTTAQPLRPIASEQARARRSVLRSCRCRRLITIR